MGGKRPLRDGAPRLLGKHDGALGRAYRRAWLAMCQEFGTPAPGSLRWLEQGRVAVSYVRWQEAQRLWVEVRRLRVEGKGRRPSAQQVERLAKRAALEEISYSQLLDRLQAMVPRTAGEPTIKDVVRQQRNGGEHP